MRTCTCPAPFPRSISKPTQKRPPITIITKTTNYSTSTCTSRPAVDYLPIGRLKTTTSLRISAGPVRSEPCSIIIMHKTTTINGLGSNQKERLVMLWTRAVIGRPTRKLRVTIGCSRATLGLEATKIISKINRISNSKTVRRLDPRSILIA